MKTGRVTGALGASLYVFLTSRQQFSDVTQTASVLLEKPLVEDFSGRGITVFGLLYLHELAHQCCTTTDPFVNGDLADHSGGVHSSAKN